MSDIIYIDQTQSTNSYLKELLQDKGLEEGTIVAANHQTAGRGQRGNSWESERGKNLTFSMLLRPHRIPIEGQFIISQLVSLAIKVVLSEYTPDITIKWPNDIYWKGLKICGILIENTLSENRIENSIVGIGLNINQKEFVSNAPNPVSLWQITQQTYDLEIILKVLQNKILDLYNELGQDDAAIAENYKNNLYRRAGYYFYSDGEKEFEAKIVDVLPTGHLVLETKNGAVRQFAFKEVKFIKL